MKKMKLITLGMIMCLSFSMMTGCGRNDNTDDNGTEENAATEDRDANGDNTDKNDDANVNDATNGTDAPRATDGTNIGNDIVDTVDDVGTDIVDGVTDIGEDLTGDDGTGNHASPSPSAGVTAAP